MKIVCFGEMLLRLSPPGTALLRQARELEMHFGGAEANVAACVAQLGIEMGADARVEAVLVSKVPANALGAAAVQFFHSLGVQTDRITRGGERLGLYFVENGVFPRPSEVVYDRKHSAITEITGDEYDWDEILRGAAWFHWTGITSALGANVRMELLKACQAAKSLGVKVSCDLNYRQKLWTHEEARSAMIPLMKYVDCCISNEQDAEICLGITRDGGGGNDDSYRQLAKQLHEHFDFEYVALSVRGGGVHKIPAGYIAKRAFIMDSAECSQGYYSKEYVYQPHEHIGGGDAFTGSLLYALTVREDSKSALEFAVAASVLKQTVPGDTPRFSVGEVRAFLSNSSSQTIVR